MIIKAKNNSVLVIEKDIYANSPREFDKVWTWVSNHREISSDADADTEMLHRYFQNRTEEVYIDNEVIILPVYVLIHSGMSFSTVPFNDKWDSGIGAIAYIKKSEYKDIFNMFVKNIEMARLRLINEVNDMNSYLNGEVFSVEEIDEETYGTLSLYNDIYGIEHLLHILRNEFGVDLSDDALNAINDAVYINS